MSKKLEVWRLQLMPYYQSLALQLYLRDDRVLRRRGDMLIAVQHPPTITVGRHSLSHGVITSLAELRRLEIPLHYTERTGGAAFHGPGQQLLYPILSIRDHKMRVRDYTDALEDVMLGVAKSFKLDAEGRRDFRPGCWIDNRMLGAVGIRVSGCVTMHGLAFNVDPDLDYYKHIVPCGLIGTEVTSLVKELGSTQGVDERAITEQLIESFVRVFRYNKVVDKEINLMELNDAVEQIIKKAGARSWITDLGSAAATGGRY